MCRVVLVFCLFFISFHATECGVYGRNGGSARTPVGKRNNQMLGTYDESYPNAQVSPKNSLSPRDLKSTGLSAWGLILIMTTVIIFGFAAYYGVICYPFLCKNERMYQFMDASSTITTTSRSIQSIENFQHDQKAAI